MDSNALETVDTDKKSKTRNVLPFLDRKPVLRKILKEYSYGLDRIQKIIDNLNEIQEELKTEMMQEELIKSKQKEQLLEILEKIKASGLSPKDFIEFCDGELNINNALANYKYEYTDLNGIKRFWSGKGKMPLALKELMSHNGTKLEDYLRNK